VPESLFTPKSFIFFFFFFFSFKDPVVIATSISSHITSPFAFWAKSTLFKGFQGRILSLLGAVPVQRQQDLQSPTTQHIDNTLLFGSSIEALREKRVLLLFPEGVSYTESHMQPLKTGAARVAQEYFTTHKSRFEFFFFFKTQKFNFFFCFKRPNCSCWIELH
jgi:hypothetical protein